MTPKKKKKFKRVMYANVYPSGYYQVHSSLSEANYNRAIYGKTIKVLVKELGKGK
jgi:hypothetical protein